MPLPGLSPVCWLREGCGECEVVPSSDDGTSEDAALMLRDGGGGAGGGGGLVVGLTPLDCLSSDCPRRRGGGERGLRGGEHSMEDGFVGELNIMCTASTSRACAQGGITHLVRHRQGKSTR